MFLENNNPPTRPPHQRSSQKDLVNKYGNYPVPRICVINKEGKTVYDSYILQHNDAQLTQLAQTLNSLTK